MPSPAADIRAAFQAGYDDALNPTAGGPAVVTTASPWLALECPVCRHTFRSGDRVVVGPDGKARHEGEGCACGSAVPEDVSKGFLAGVIAAVGNPDGLRLTVLTAGHPLLSGPEFGFPRKRCPVCAHTFRPNEMVVVCPCYPSDGEKPRCEWAVHRDPARGLLCWEALQQANTRCPVRGAKP